MTLRPHVSQFYDREIEEMVAERFREDFERYGYSTTLT